MDRDESWRVIDEQRQVLAGLLETLTPEEWATPSLCDEWTVRDVAAHLSVAATIPTGEALRWLVRARGSFDRMIHDSAVDRARRPTGQIVADLRGVVGSRKLAPGTFWRDPLLDVLVHGQDIARPLGKDLATPPEAAAEAADWAVRRAFPYFWGRRLRGLRLVAEDVDWSRGEGPEVRGPMASLLLVSTGRAAGLADTSGPGLGLLAERYAAA
jgi:uncharacterized protein (TIGR03083 family)